MMKRRFSWGNLLAHLALTAVGVTMLLPFLWMVMTALKSPTEVFSVPPVWLPRQLQLRDGDSWRDVELLSRRPARLEVTILEGVCAGRSEKITDRRLKGSAAHPLIWVDEGGSARQLRAVRIDSVDAPARNRVLIAGGDDASGEERVVGDSELRRVVRFRFSNFVEAWREARLARAYFNSLLVALAVTAGQVLTSAMAAFAFGRIVFRGRDQLFLVYLATLMVPGSVTMIPVFILVRMLGLCDTYAGLILPPLFSAYGTFLLRQFFLTLPKEIEQAAELDGCGYWRIFWNVVLPMSRPALATLAIFTFIGNWRSFMWPLIVTNRTEMRTLPLSLIGFQGEYMTDWTLLMAASLLTIIPMVIIFLWGQRHFVAGIQLGGVKG